MYVKQVSIFVENKNGSISECISILGKANINIRALSVADTADFGILRLIVDDPEKAFELLSAANYTLKITKVLGVIVPDKPNGLGEVLDIIHANNMEITYIYAFIGSVAGKATVMLKTDNLEETETVLRKNHIEIVNQEDILKN